MLLESLFLHFSCKATLSLCLLSPEEKILVRNPVVDNERETDKRKKVMRGVNPVIRQKIARDSWVGWFQDAEH